ncbi:MAG: SIS domain-containing protein [Hyphomicrobiaceae bacterium]|nr:SIS domain-containing protein [Hyphomicrobiaceae bacterium]
MDASYTSAYRAFLDGGMAPFVDAYLALMERAGAKARYYFAGNGASAAIASHLANDFTKAVGVRASTFHDPALLTCFGNDYGFDNWLSEAVTKFGESGDVLVLISSSGRSANIVRAAEAAKAAGMHVVALTGPRPSERLVAVSDVSLMIQSEIYNVIENCHMMALCAVVDSRNLVLLAG